MANVTGWNELVNGTIVESSYSLFNSSFAGSFLLVAFMTLSITLLIKTKSATISFVAGMIFFTMFYSYLNPLSLMVMIPILIFEMGASMYQSFFKE